MTFQKGLGKNQSGYLIKFSLQGIQIRKEYSVILNPSLPTQKHVNTEGTFVIDQFH
jgi:hypothetical protein